MTDLQQSERTDRRPVTVVVAAALVAVAAAVPLAQLLFLLPLRPSLGMTVPFLLSGLATAACWAVPLPGLLRGRSWAQVAVTALAALALAQGLPGVLNALLHAPDPVLLGYTAAALVPLAVVALLWTPGARAWFGPLR
jgi:inner membrane protein involved in colicin E2 resistance